MPIIEGWKFPIDVDKKTGKIQTVQDNENVRQSVNIILKTQILERKLVPNFGSEVRTFMFEVVDANYIAYFKKSLKSAINNWEEHVTDLQINVRSQTGPASRIEASINYKTDISPKDENIVTTVKMDGIT
ncbi:MAG: GPW/gp25 family protein [Candidatus Improbicoccus devescovinae]|nr:MAG: GPW/gp25 family protein [Candidatus Improbicoccus devescovinae]